MNRATNRTNTRRRQLLSTVSAIALIGTIYGVDRAQAADDAVRPPLWLEFGWHYEHMSGLGDVFDPPLTDLITGAGFSSPLNVQRRLSYSYGGEGKISFQPDDSEWIFTAAVRYGRAYSRQLFHQQNDIGPLTFHVGALPSQLVRTPYVLDFADTVGANSETHMVADFQVGRDVGLGLFRGATSQLGIGIRFAQMKSHSTIRMDTIPDYVYSTNLKYDKYHHRYTASAESERSFQGMGPAISWNGSAPLLGNREDGAVTFDWGANAALLFGRQRTTVHHQSTSAYYNTNHFRPGAKYIATHDHHPPVDTTRSRSVSVPNIGGFAGLSVRYPNVKLSLGYRADFFLGAIDGGIDTRNSIARGFAGPFASISIGLGD